MTTTREPSLAQLAKLWRREREAAQAREVEQREQLSLQERVERGLALCDLDVEDTDAMAGGRTLLWVRSSRRVDLDNLRIQVGDPVRAWRDTESEYAIVARRDGDRLGLAVEADYGEFLEDGGFHLDREAPQVTFDRGDAALDRLRNAEPGSAEERQRALLFGDAVPSVQPVDDLTCLDHGLNDVQKLAVRRALGADRLALVHGPPGTGKTRTLVEVVRAVVARGERVLVTAASNTAVDNLAERLIQHGVAVVRLGHPARVAPSVEARSLDALVDRSEDKKLARKWIADANELRRKARKRKERGSIDRREQRRMFFEARELMRDARKAVETARRQVLSACPVVCATAAGADSAVLGERRFDLVVLDEATQAPDPMALCAVWRAERLVLAGDPCQLPPTVLDRQAEAEGLGTTFFERLSERHGEPVLTTLQVQYRMHERLMAFPSRSMYGGKLVAAPEVAGRLLDELQDVQPDPLRPQPLCFVDTAGTGHHELREGDDPSTQNAGHAELVVAEVLRLLERGLPAREVAIITPYDAQARLLREPLREARAQGLEIGTVDGFQGREKEAIVLDLVRSNDQAAIGFLADRRRMNVALTRAKRFLLVVGDSATLGPHGYYSQFLQEAEDQGAYLSAWSLADG